MRLLEHLDRLVSQRLAAYSANPGDIREHHGIEQTVLAGGYGYRQILELVQNGADAILEETDLANVSDGENRIEVRLSDRHIYVANTGAPLSPEGLEAILRSHTSPKRGIQIGRFGLGFKSLLALEGSIDILTRSSGCVRFDPERCRQELHSRFGETNVPGLRLAWEIDPKEREDDPIAASMSWAETIVRAEINRPEAIKRLRNELSKFPAEFLLFFPVPVVLDLIDERADPKRLSVEIDGRTRRLQDGEAASKWIVFEKLATIDEASALNDATHIHARDEIPVAWAVPLEGRREEIGRFWAFFPTQSQTRISGILNAPWKLNSDRNAIIGGAWNEALMAVSAQLVHQSLPSLATEADPARPLDSFPRRMDSENEVAAPLTEGIWTALETMKVIPDANGELRRASELWMHPTDSRDLVDDWSALSTGHTSAGVLVHPSCITRSRLSRLDALKKRLLEAVEGKSDAPNLQRYPEPEWFECIASTDTDTAKGVFRLADRFLKEKNFQEVRHLREELRIIPTVKGELVTPKVALISKSESLDIPGRHPVALELLKDPIAKQTLMGTLDVGEPDRTTWLQVLQEAVNAAGGSWREFGETNDERWTRVWSSLRGAPAAIAKEFVARHAKARDHYWSSSISVKRSDGRWVAWHRTLLPGGVIKSKDDADNLKFAVDAFHLPDDIELLRILGVDLKPTDLTVVVSSGQRLLEDWITEADQKYRSNPQVSRNPLTGYLRPKDLSMPAGWELLPNLSGAAKSRLTRALLAVARERSLKTNLFGHKTSTSYPDFEYRHPIYWWLAVHGSAHIGGEAVPLRALISRLDALPEALSSNYRDLVEPFESQESWSPTVSVKRRDLLLFWQALLRQEMDDDGIESGRLSDLFSSAADDGFVPPTLRYKGTEFALDQVFVTTSPDLAEHIRGTQKPAVVLSQHAMDAWIEEGAIDLATVIEPRWAEETGPTLSIVQVFPELREVLSKRARARGVCRTVSGLRLSLGDSAKPAPCIFWKDILLVDQEQLSRKTHSDRLRSVLTEIKTAGWVALPLDEALAKVADADVERRREQVAAQTTLAERLVAAVGKRRRHLLAALGSVGELDEVSGCENLKLAELVLAHLGTSTLSAMKDAFKEEGLNPPDKWTPARAAEFVASIGFPTEYIAAGTARRPSMETISGPIKLPKLHDYQEEVLEGLRAVLEEGSKQRRAVVSLPTGGGKTRVTVEAAVRLALNAKTENRSVLWIAQTDELCEQAVQAFRQVWVNCGSDDIDLTILRLWGGGSNPKYAPPMPLVAVASIQTMNSRMGSEALSWLGRPSLVVVDECHHAIAKSYTNLLRWLDADGRSTEEEREKAPPIIGLSATPFRGADEESERLAKRFENRWLPSDQENLYHRLLEQEILAKPKYEAIQSKATLSKAEASQLAAIGDDLEGFQAAGLIERINSRLAEDGDRNKLLLKHVVEAEEDSILFFANSVAHAEEFAARLNLRGVAAAAVSGSTAPSARRDFLGRFQDGRIKVLCNHSVLTTGFDAPKTEMILIARQVFSPVRYMQMVGRGLRGPKNGGTPSCRIVSVLDNLGRFADRHPYHYCKQYFTAAEASLTAE